MNAPKLHLYILLPTAASSPIDLYGHGFISPSLSASVADELSAKLLKVFSFSLPVFNQRMSGATVLAVTTLSDKSSILIAANDSYNSSLRLYLIRKPYRMFDILEIFLLLLIEIPNINIFTYLY